jgi:RimJ/RimL family protein N-acetyltransferase
VDVGKTHAMEHPIWPLFDLVLRTERLVLRPLDPARAEALAHLGTGPIHDGRNPFLVPWNDGEPDEVAKRSYLHHLARIGEWAPDRWNLSFATYRAAESPGGADELIGSQSAHAEGWLVRRTASTGSWLARDRQGRGYGREMRSAVLHLLFECLGAVRAETGAWADNAASLAVTRSLGYRPNGDTLRDQAGEARRELLFAMERAEWEAQPRPPVAVEGLEPCLPLFGV